MAISAQSEGFLNKIDENIAAIGVATMEIASAVRGIADAIGDGTSIDDPQELAAAMALRADALGRHGAMIAPDDEIWNRLLSRA